VCDDFGLSNKDIHQVASGKQIEQKIQMVPVLK
jgi:hypothetical protein